MSRSKVKVSGDKKVLSAADTPGCVRMVCARCKQRAAAMDRPISWLPGVFSGAICQLVVSALVYHLVSSNNTFSIVLLHCVMFLHSYVTAVCSCKVSHLKIITCSQSVLQLTYKRSVSVLCVCVISAALLLLCALHTVHWHVVCVTQA